MSAGGGDSPRSPGRVVLDAGVLIAHFERDDAHHAAASEFFIEHADDLLAANAVNLAESLVRTATDRDALEELLEDIEILGVTPLDVPGGSSAGIAMARAESGLRMPDALLLHSAELTAAALATTDERVARAAEARGIPTILVG